MTRLESGCQTDIDIKVLGPLLLWCVCVCFIPSGLHKSCTSFLFTRPGVAGGTLRALRLLFAPHHSSRQTALGPLLFRHSSVGSMGGSTEGFIHFPVAASLSWPTTDRRRRGEVHPALNVAGCAGCCKVGGREITYFAVEGCLRLPPQIRP